MRPLVKSDSDPANSWGAPALDPSVAATPTSPAAATVTQATQAANETERAVQAVSQLPPPPFGAALVGADGRVSQSWMPWLTRLYQRSGGAITTPAGDMDILTEFDDLPVPPYAQDPALEWAEPSPRPIPDVLEWLGSLTPPAQIALLAQQVDALTGLVLSLEDRGWNRQPGLTTPAAAAPAGGTGTAAGGWDTAVNRDAAIATINNLRTRLGEVEAVLKAVRIL